MSATEHEHKWVSSGSNDCRCECGATLWAVQEFLDHAAEDVRTAAGESYYTGCRIRSETNEVELYLASAPAQLVEEIEALPQLST